MKDKDKKKIFLNTEHTEAERQVSAERSFYCNRASKTSQEVQSSSKAPVDMLAANVEALVDNAPDGIFRIDRSFRHTFLNRAMERFTGLPREELLGSRLEDWIFLSENMRNEMKKTAREVFETGLPLDLHVTYPMGCGTRYFETRLMPERDLHGQVTAIVGIIRDITDIREKERALAVEHAFREAVENSIIVGITALDTEGRQTYVNKGFCMMVGWEPKDLLGKKPPFPYWPEGERERITKQFKKILLGKVVAGSFETRFERRTGDIFDALVIFSELLDGSGKRIGWVCSVGDISERTRRGVEMSRLNEELEQRVIQRTAELEKKNRELDNVLSELLQISERLEFARDEAFRQKKSVKSILDTVPAGVALIDTRGSLTYCNARSIELWGKIPAEKAGTLEYVRELHLSDADGRPFDPLELPSSRALFKGEEVRGAEIIFKRPDGSKLTVLTNATPMQGPEGFSGVVLAFMDITEIKRAQELSQRLNAINLQLLACMDNEVNMQYAMTEGAKSMQADSAALFLLVNANEWVVRNVYGLPDDLIGITISDNEEPRLMMAVQNGYPFIVEDTLNDERVNVAHVRKYGIRSGIAVPIIRERGPFGLLFFNFSSPRKFSLFEINFCVNLAASISFSIQNTALFNEIKSHSDSLELANMDLEAFSHSVSHDLRAPLIVIDGFSRRLLEKIEFSPGSKGIRYIENIRESCRHGISIVDDLLGLFRATRAQIEREDVDLTRLMARISQKTRSIEPERRVKISIQKCLSAVGDRRLLAIALQNLFENAWKFTSSREKAVIEFGQDVSGGETVFFIHDNGCGFENSHAERIFKPFQRAHSHEEYPGTGLGLVTVQRIIHNHGGRIWTEGEPGKGAVFYFTLPPPVTRMVVKQ